MDKKTMALWKEGMTKDGSESMSKLNAAIGEKEKAAFASATKKAERMEENAAIKNHVQHPTQWARAGAESTEAGLKMANHLIGDDIKEVENARKGEQKYAEKEDPKTAGKVNKMHT